MKCPEDVKEACLQIMQVTWNSVRFPRGFHRQNYMSSVGYLYEDRFYFKERIKWYEGFYKFLT